MSGIRFETEKEEDSWLQVVLAALSGAKSFPDGGITKMADQVVVAMRDRQPVERKPYGKPFNRFTPKPTPDKEVVQSTDTK